MVKKLVALAFLLGLLGGPYPISELSAQQDTIIVGGAWPNKTFTPDLRNPVPSIPQGEQADAADSARTGWGYFWMFDDGVYSRLPGVARSFAENKDYNTALKVRGKYTDDPEPPRMPARVPAGGPTTAPFPADSMPQDREMQLIANWDAARVDDTVYLALSVKNRNDAFSTRSGKVSLLFPRREIQFLGEVLPGAVNRFGTASITHVSETATLCEWALTDIPAFQTQTLFVEVSVTSSARDSMFYLLQAKVDWNDEQSNTVNVSLPTLLGVSKDKGGTAASNPFYFEPESEVALRVNRSRDPNDLIVRPGTAPPAVPAPVHLLEYTVFVENIGNASAPNLNVEVEFDDKVDLGLGSYQFVGHDFKKAVTIPANPCCTGNKAVFDLNNIQLPPSLGGVNPAGKGSFTFTMKTKPGLNLQVGDSISANGLIRMINNNRSVEDSVETGPASVMVQKPGRPCYGWLLGLKWHNYLPNPDSARNTGLNLTFQVPLVRPRQDVLKTKYLKAPSWFWQFELGVATSAFYLPGDPGRYKTWQLHLTPAQIRYTNIKAGPVQMGVSAGYSTGLVFSATRENASETLKSGLGNRLEHELAATIDAFNLTGVPGLSIGAGYKHRFNHLFADKVDYGFPFAYLQLNFARFQKRQTQLWNKIYRH